VFPDDQKQVPGVEETPKKLVVLAVASLKRP
jgi:hypothetical protein